MKVKKFDLVELSWRDSCKQQQNWMLENKFNYAVGDSFADSMKSCGFFLKRTRFHTYISQEFCHSDNGISNVISIPNSNIIKFRKLR